jgi:hypothetical protein
MALGSVFEPFLYTAAATGFSVTRPASAAPSLGLMSSFQSGVETVNQPVSENPVVKPGYLMGMFGQLDFYDRMHVIPGTLALGNLLSSQVRQVEVWNAYRVPVTLIGVEESNADGITLTQPSVTPMAYTALRSAFYEVQVALNGSPVIDALYTFSFSSGEVMELPVTGRRVIVWAFSPQNGYTETLEWKTDVLRAKAGEKRQALRKVPRQSFDHTYWLTPKQYAAARAVSYGWGQRVFGVPVWGEATRLGALAAARTSLNFDTQNADYRVGDALLIWQDYDKFEACEITSMTTTETVLRLPTSGTYTDAFVMPLRYGRSLNGLNAERDESDIITAEVTFEVAQSVDLSASVSLPQYKGVDVLTDLMMKVGNYSEKVIREVTVIDNVTGTPTQDPRYTTPTQSFTVSWDLTNRVELWRMRKWLHSRKGKQKSFWLPTKLRDFDVIQDITAGANSVTINNMSYGLFYGVRYLSIKSKSGAAYYNKITGSALNEDNTETLFLEDAVTVTVTLANIEYVCLLHKVRLDADRVELEHNVNQVTISIPALEVPE